MSKRGKDILVALRAEVLAAVSEHVAEKHVAERIAEDIVLHVQQAYAGEQVYIPIPGQDELRERVLEDWRRGACPAEIARRRGISVRTVYRYLGKRPRMSRDGGFGSEDWNL